MDNPKCEARGASADELARARRRRERRMREGLVLEGLPLVYSSAARYRGTGRQREELVRVASLGLVRAAERFAPGSGRSFGAFAVARITAELDAHVHEAPGSDVPEGGGARAERRERDGAAAEQLIARLMARQTHLRELADSLGLPADAVAQGLMAAAIRQSVPLYAPAEEDGAASGGPALGRTSGIPGQGLGRGRSAAA